MAAEPEPSIPAGRRSVLVVDDHPVFRDGMRACIDATNDLWVCADTDDALLAQRLVAEVRPDVAVVDISLRRGSDDGLAVVAWIRSHHPATRVVVASIHDEHLYGERALRAGASGYVSKCAPARSVLEAIRRACEGQIYFGSGWLPSRAQYGLAVSPPDVSTANALSDRELQVFRFIGQGLSSKQIAAALVLSISTVDTYRKRLKCKLGFRGNAELVHRATRWSIEQP